MAISELDQMKQGVRATWAAGDYPAIAQRQLWPVGERVVQRVAVQRGEEVLDVACGTGNAALRAAAAGGRVTGIDLTPELLEVARRLASEQGADIDYVEGDAEALPVATASFDVAVSVFGAIFAPRHAVAAHELARVLRPGGRVCLTAWTPEGSMGDFFRTIGGYLPPPPPFAQPPLLWGSEEHVRGLFAPSDLDLTFERETLDFPRDRTLDEEIDFMTTSFGPMIMARRMLPGDRWDALVGDVRRLLVDPRPAEYLVVSGHKR
jgi:ubiquinone/menaquinone biosynthesis C-methylase UbiE